MSEDDRAAKAARAKALLKRRREKAGGAPTASSATPTSGAASPATPSRILSPAPPEPLDDKLDLGDVFTKDDADTSWLTSLPRAASPAPAPAHPARVASPPGPPGRATPARLAASPPSISPAPVSGVDAGKLHREIAALGAQNAALAAEVGRLESSESKAQQVQALLEQERNRSRDLGERLQGLDAEKTALLLNEQQTISLLVSEKSSLTAELRRLEGVETNAQALETSLGEERQRSSDLGQLVKRLQAEARDAAKTMQESLSKERELAERCREQERQIQITTGAVNDLKQEAGQHQRRVRELEEQIQSDDRVERLETSLKNTQDRADELDFQLSKLKQAHTALKQERDELDSQRHLHSTAAQALGTKHTELEAQHTAALHQLTAAASENATLSQSNTDLQAQATAAHTALAAAEAQLAGSTTELATATRQLHAAQSELRHAARRADDAEATQRDLQAEGTRLLQALDEVRPKIVELTGAKLELAERVAGLEHALRGRDAVVAELEGAAEEARDGRVRAEAHAGGLERALEGARAEGDARQREHEAVLGGLQEELDGARAGLKNLEAERAVHYQEAARRLEEVERLGSTAHAQAEELSTLRRELDARRHVEDEDEDFLERAQTEIEALRADLAAREDELQHLRAHAPAPPASAGAGPSLDGELLSSLRQQHALDLSAAHTQIRTLEHSVFDAEARAHALQRHAAALEEQLHGPRAPSRAGSRLGHGHGQSPLGGRRGSGGDLRRASFGAAGVGAGAGGRAGAGLGQGLSAETRHKRLVSLSMLKARIDSEVAGRAESRASSVRGLSPVRSVGGSVRGGGSEGYTHVSLQVAHKPQFLDESHVFWCHSCTGDLVIL